jgi:hypothetical protein
MKDLEDQLHLIKNCPSDIRAEVLLADLILDGLSPSDILIFFNSSFKRRYSNDILKVEKLNVNNVKEILGITLSRDGLYDLLPEGLFHSEWDEPISSAKGMSSSSKKESRVEEETRKFFLPFENEFFYQRIQLELQERSILRKLNDNNLDEFFLDFWKVDRSLPRELCVKLTSMLPFVKDIAGDFMLTASCLSAILGEDVTQATRYASITSSEADSDLPDDIVLLGNMTLGINSVIGKRSPENCKLIRFTIGPLRQTGIDPYMKKGDIARFIDCFSGFFIPMEMDVEFEVLMSHDLQSFVLSTENIQIYLGYSTLI